jgi:nitroimidazol reductase NimA-like FMN-containing flavoprotein (pyridoxamine 5'-phosphate oxidase superfamily)
MSPYRPGMEQFAPTARTRVRRVPQRAAYDRATVEAILDEGLVCHLAFVRDGHPFCVPTLYARAGDTLYLHGATKARWAGVARACLTVTLLDGLVLARSAFHHSMNYRSVTIVGPLRPVEPPAEKLAALEAFTERLVAGRWATVRPPSRQELKATAVLAMPLAEASAKVRSGGPVDDDEDYALPVWAGVVPLRLQAGDPVPDARLAGGIPVPDHVRRWSTERSSA